MLAFTFYLSCVSFLNQRQVCDGQRDIQRDGRIIKNHETRFSDWSCQNCGRYQYTLETSFISQSMARTVSPADRQ